MLTSVHYKKKVNAWWHFGWKRCRDLILSAQILILHYFIHLYISNSSCNTPVCVCVSLMEAVKHPEVKRTLGVLQVAKSRVLRTWRELVSFWIHTFKLKLKWKMSLIYSSYFYVTTDWLVGWLFKDKDFTVVANEAKDNVKYLYTLDKFFRPLGKCTPVKNKLSLKDIDIGYR